jgi:hypothetical protein
VGSLKMVFDLLVATELDERGKDRNMIRSCGIC